MERLRQRGQTTETDSQANTLPKYSSPTSSEAQRAPITSWIWMPLLGLLTTLLVGAVCTLRAESHTVLSQHKLTTELKSQIHSLRQEIVLMKSKGSCTSRQLVTDMQDQLHKYQWEAEKLRKSKEEGDKQMQELLKRMTALQGEYASMKLMLKTLKSQGVKPAGSTQTQTQ